MADNATFSPIDIFWAFVRWCHYLKSPDVIGASRAWHVEEVVYYLIWFDLLLNGQLGQAVIRPTFINLPFLRGQCTVVSERGGRKVGGWGGYACTFWIVNFYDRRPSGVTFRPPANTSTHLQSPLTIICGVEYGLNEPNLRVSRQKRAKKLLHLTDLVPADQIQFLTSEMVCRCKIVQIFQIWHPIEDLGR